MTVDDSDTKTTIQQVDSVGEMDIMSKYEEMMKKTGSCWNFVILYIYTAKFTSFDVLFFGCPE